MRTSFNPVPHTVIAQWSNTRMMVCFLILLKSHAIAADDRVFRSRRRAEDLNTAAPTFILEVSMRLLLLILGLVVPVSAQFPNSGFENWTGPNPDSCWVNNSVVAPVIKSSASYQGSFALRGEVVSYVGVPYGPQLTVGSIQGFAYTGRPGSVRFYYQFAPQGGDKFEASITLRKSNPIKIIAAGAPVKITTAASSYTLLTVPLEYFYAETPDVCVATFLITNPSSEHVGSYFLLDEIGFVGTASGVGKNDGQPYAAFQLEQNYPNPFNPSTTITYSIPERSNVRISVFSILGRKISDIVDETKDAGSYEQRFTAPQLSSGVYFYRIEVISCSSGRAFIETKKMIMMK